uniref:Alternative protein DOCK3 n=1 Tax=Homo sapiens TaxID=9606 RepID=L8E7Q6_HUMAN|nr:alternative protein DOCK3 [Homo sapiens]
MMAPPSQMIFTSFMCTSVMRIARLITMLCTWACPAAKRTTMAALIFLLASSSSAAPKSLSSSPLSSPLPNSPRMWTS